MCIIEFVVHFMIHQKPNTEEFFYKDQITGNAKEFAGKVKQQWAEITDDEIDKAEGSIEQLTGIIQRKYGETREAIRAKLDELNNGDHV